MLSKDKVIAFETKVTNECYECEQYLNSHVIFKEVESAEGRMIACAQLLMVHWIRANVLNPESSVRRSVFGEDLLYNVSDDTMDMWLYKEYNWVRHFISAFEDKFYQLDLLNIRRIAHEQDGIIEKALWNRDHVAW